MMANSTASENDEEPSLSGFVEDGLLVTPMGHRLDLTGDTETLHSLSLDTLLDETLRRAVVAKAVVEITLALEDDTVLQRLNRDWRQKDKPTNVLSFPAFNGTPELSSLPTNGETAIHIGDIIISGETAAREAEETGKAFEDHLRHLFVHGVLHLLGYDHIEDVEAEEMEALEVVVLAKFGVSNPYRFMNEGPIDG